MAKEEVDLLIVGAGPVGLLLAVLTERAGLKVKLVEKEMKRSPYSKAFGLHARSLELLHSFGITSVEERLAKSVVAGSWCQKLSVTLGPGREACVDFDVIKDMTQYPFMGMLSQKLTEECFEECLQSVRVERGVRLVGLQQDDKGVDATILTASEEEVVVRSKWVVGCDGAHSTTRGLLKLPFSGSKYKDTFFLADLELDMGSHPPLRQGCAQVFFGASMLVIFPLQPGLVRLVSRRPSTLASTSPPSPSNKQVDHGPRLTGPATSVHEEATLQDFQALLDLYLPGVKAKNPQWLSAFKLHRRIVDRYQCGRVFLAGDAAHIHSPAGGQGNNLGMQDAINLAWKLGLVHKGWSACPDSLMHSYGTERRPIALGVLAVTDRIMKGFSAVSLFLFRSLVLPVMPYLLRSRWFQLSTASTMAQLKMSYANARSPIIQQDLGLWWLFFFLSKPGVAAGSRLPHLPLHRADSTATTTLAVSANGLLIHTLLLITADEEATKEAEVVRAAVADFARALHVVVVVSGKPEKEKEKSGCLFASKDVLSAFGVGRGLTQSRRAAYLIRPDGYIGYRSLRGWDVKGLRGYLQGLLVPAAL